MKTNLKGYKVLSYRLSEDSSVERHIFIKENKTNTIDKPKDCTLNALNVPIFVGKDIVKKAFSSAGAVKNVFLENKSSTPKETTHCKITYVVFEKPSGLQNALNLTELKPLVSSSDSIVAGLGKWIKEYNDSILNVETLKENVEKQWNQHYKAEQKLKREQKKQKDDGGWTVVTKGGRNPGNSRKKSLSDKVAEKNKEVGKRRYLQDFYVFQKREAKMKRVTEMREEFERTKKKVEALRQARKFKPY